MVRRMRVLKAKSCKYPRMFMCASMCDFWTLPFFMDLAKLLAHTYHRDREPRPLLLERYLDYLL